MTTCDAASDSNVISVIILGFSSTLSLPTVLCETKRALEKTGRLLSRVCVAFEESEVSGGRVDPRALKVLPGNRDLRASVEHWDLKVLLVLKASWDLRWVSWRWHGNAVRIIGLLCEESIGYHSKGPMMWSYDVAFVVSPKKLLHKEPVIWYFIVMCTVQCTAKHLT